MTPLSEDEEELDVLEPLEDAVVVLVDSVDEDPDEDVDEDPDEDVDVVFSSDMACSLPQELFGHGNISAIYFDLIRIFFILLMDVANKSNALIETKHFIANPSIGLARFLFVTILWSEGGGVKQQWL